MQTFLPYRDFARSAAVLDDLRLGKQRVEAMQILRALTRPVYGWKHHPAVRMWAGYEEALAAYALAVSDEWCSRGRADTCAATILVDLAEAGIRVPPRSQRELADAGALPPWLGRRAFHTSHQASLVRKLPEHYRRHFPKVDETVPYVWPPEPRSPVPGSR